MRRGTIILVSGGSFSTIDCPLVSSDAFLSILHSVKIGQIPAMRSQALQFTGAISFPDGPIRCFRPLHAFSMKRREPIRSVIAPCRKLQTLKGDPRLPAIIF